MLYLVQELIVLASFVLIANPLFYAFFYYLLINKNEKFKDLSYETRRYVIKNLSKSVFLCFLSIYSVPSLLELVRTGIWPNGKIRFLGNIYCATDIAGLLFVPNLPFTTQLHHTVVTFCAIANILVDYQKPGIHRAMIFLAYCSMVPYLVNTLLGMRPLGFPKLKKRLAKIASVIYAISIACNCTYQHYYVIFSGDYLVLRGLYLVLYWIILHDDLILLNYLTFVGFQFDFWPYLQETYKVLGDAFEWIGQIFRTRSFWTQDLGNSKNEDNSSGIKIE